MNLVQYLLLTMLLSVLLCQEDKLSCTLKVIIEYRLFLLKMVLNATYMVVKLVKDIKYIILEHLKLVTLLLMQ